MLNLLSSVHDECGPALTPIHDYWKNCSLTVLVKKVMSWLFYTLYRFAIAFLPRSKRLLILWLQSPSTVILDPKKRKYVNIYTFLPTICHEMIGQNVIILVFLMLSFKAAFSLSSFTLIKRLFSSSSISAN